MVTLHFMEYHFRLLPATMHDEMILKTLAMVTKAMLANNPHDNDRLQNLDFFIPLLLMMQVVSLCCGAYLFA
jgi:hypothetical protein